MLALGVGQSLSQIGHRVVQREEAHRQLRLLGLFLLILGRAFLGAPLVLLHLVHLVQRLHLAHPGIHHGVDVALPAGKVSGNVGNQIQSFLLTMHIERYPRCQRPDGGTDGGHDGHC